MANEKRLIDANALCEFFQERYEYLRNASERQLPNGYVEVDLEIQCGAIIAKEFLDKAKNAPTVEVVHGRWIEKAGRAMCSACSDECWADSVMEYNYCPNCGAKMDGERRNDG